jgi:iron(III) transport system substrate-binding protein
VFDRSRLSRRRLLAAGSGAFLLAACAPAAPSTPAPAARAAPSATTQPATPTAAAGGGGRPAVTTPASVGAAAPTKGGGLTVYSGRTEKLVAPLLERFTKETGLPIKARYGDTAELAAAILEEGTNSPADLFFAQDAGALGAVAAEGKLVKLPDALLQKVEDRFRSPTGEWVGLSGRARTLIYNTEKVQEAELPDSVHGLSDPRWKDRLGWAPTNGSFQAFVTAMRLVEGDPATKSWLQAIKANGVKAYQNNTAQVQAAGSGEILVGMPNHYYVFSFYKEQGESFPARNYHPRGGGPDAMVNVAGAGILATSKNQDAGARFVEFMLGQEAQQYFANETFEYPLIPGIKTPPQLKPLSDIRTPRIDLGSLTDLKGTLKLLQEAGVL